MKVFRPLLYILFLWLLYFAAYVEARAQDAPPDATLTSNDYVGSLRSNIGFTFNEWLTIAQTPAPVRWPTYQTKFNNVVFTAKESGNYLVFGIETTTAAYWVLKSSLMKTTVLRDTVKIPTICPACPPPPDPKLSQDYKDLLVKFNDMSNKYTDCNQSLAQEINLVNVYQQENDKLNAERVVLIAELRKYKDELLKYRKVTILVPIEKDSL